MKNYEGKRFGKLVVKNFSHKKNNVCYWNCICDCGNEKTIRITNLTTGLTTSCGCSRYKDLIGKRFGKLVVVSLVSREKGTRWLCKCDCGNEKILKQNNLLSKNTRSCGCLFKEAHRFGNPVHNLYHTRIYSIWKSMKERCYSKKHVGYEKYGGRGITICDEWLGKNGIVNFYNWSIANGYQDDLSIDRIDNNKGYSPDNCRWVDAFVQQNNRSISKFYEYNGEKLTLSQLSRKYNINKTTLMHRLQKYSVKESIERPIDKSKSRVKKEEI